jgi:hypothetical protein
VLWVVTSELLFQNEKTRRSGARAGDDGAIALICWTSKMLCN